MRVVVVGAGTVDEKWVEHSLFSAVVHCSLGSVGWLAGVGTLFTESRP